MGLAEGTGADAKAHAEVDSRVLYRVGETIDGTSTYTPRLVFFDLSGKAPARAPDIIFPHMFSHLIHMNLAGFFITLPSHSKVFLSPVVRSSEDATTTTTTTTTVVSFAPPPPSYSTARWVASGHRATSTATRRRHPPAAPSRPSSPGTVGLHNQL